MPHRYRKGICSKGVIARLGEIDAVINGVGIRDTNKRQDIAIAVFDRGVTVR